MRYFPFFSVSLGILLLQMSSFLHCTVLSLSIFPAAHISIEQQDCNFQSLVLKQDKSFRKAPMTFSSCTLKNSKGGQCCVARNTACYICCESVVVARRAALPAVLPAFNNYYVYIKTGNEMDSEQLFVCHYQLFISKIMCE